MATTNEYGQPIGDDLGSWTPPELPSNETVLTGSHVRLEPLDPDAHGPALWDALVTAPDSLWTYMSVGPFTEEAGLTATLRTFTQLANWQAYTIVAADGPAGFCSYLRIDQAGGVIEIGSIVFGPDLQRTTAATECLFLMIDHAFALGYRRVEWKCDDLNEPSRSAARRLGFTYEGTFRKATHYKGRNRDTAWFAIVDDDWRQVRRAFESWLSPDNFDDDGVQRRPLAAGR
ncbi:MAG: GNAT family protein [Acidimicrobiales bacterium]